MSAAGAVQAFDAGLDYRPSDQATAKHLVLATATIFDAIKVSGTVWLLFKDGSDVNVSAYDLTTGVVTGTETTALTPDTTGGSHEAEGINSANVELCAPESAAGQTLTFVSGTTYSLPDIGVLPGSIAITGSDSTGGGGTCTPVYAPGSFVDGRRTATPTTTTDRIKINGRGGCNVFTASYSYTNCRLDDAYACEMADGSGDLGYCKLFMVYEAWADVNAGTPDDRHLLMAHAQEMNADWTRWQGGTATAYPDDEDVLIANTGPHEGSSTAGQYSFAGVPDLLWDSDLGRWRMWFVTEDTGMAPIRYSESMDDGQSWGISSYAQPQDCHDGATYDAAACTLIEWVQIGFDVDEVQ